MNRFLKVIFSIALLVFGTKCALVEAAPATGEASPTPTLTLEQEKKDLELEKLQLENEKLKLELERAKLQAAPTGEPEQKGDDKDKEEKERAVDAFQTSMSQKAEALAKENKDKENVVVLDLVNSEMWCKGVRYSVHEMNDIAEDNRWKIDKRLDELDPGGDSRNLYRLRNISLLRYDTRKRGILEITAPVQEDDFQFLTPEGVSFTSGIGDVRNAYQSLYFAFDGENHENRHVILKYIHKVEWNFSDRLNFDFDRDGKLVKIRYGVLDEK